MKMLSRLEADRGVQGQGVVHRVFENGRQGVNIILNLTIKRRWFDMIERGEKSEEYRSVDNAQARNACGSVAHGWPTGGGAMVLRNGYRMDSPAVAVRVFGMTIRSGAQAEHPEWGEPTGRGAHFAIMFDRIIVRGIYAEVKEALEKKKQETERMK